MTLNDCVGTVSVIKGCSHGVFATAIYTKKQ